MGLAASDVFVVENGEVLELSDGRLRQAENIDAGPIWLQSRAGGLLPMDILRDRQQMNESGAVQVVLVVDASGAPQQDLLISSRGVAEMPPGSPLERAVRAEAQTALAELPVTERRSDTALEQALERGVRRAMKRETGRRPVVLAQVLRIA